MTLQQRLTLRARTTAPGLYDGIAGYVIPRLMGIQKAREIKNDAITHCGGHITQLRHRGLRFVAAFLQRAPAAAPRARARVAASAPLLPAPRNSFTISPSCKQPVSNPKP